MTVKTWTMKNSFSRCQASALGWLAAMLLSAAVSAGEQTCSGIKYLAPSGQGNDIVFVFDKPYVCGRFANGDWWVSADESGMVTLASTQPEAEDGMHGAEVNPASSSRQGFDKRIKGYDASLNAGFPLRLRGDVSVVKTVSVPRDQKKCRPCVQFAAVLTVVKSPVPNSENVLRPGYFGVKKSYHPVTGGIASRLPRLPASCCSEAQQDDFIKIARRYQGVQLDHLEGWTGRGMHPIDSMPDYGAEIATDNAASALRFMLDDFRIGNKTHNSALMNYLQMAADLQSMAEGGVKWPANGGHGNGRKLPLAVAARLLRNQAFLDALRAGSFSEDEQVYFSPVAQQALYGRKCSDPQYWMIARSGRGPRDCRDPYGLIDGGGREIGEAYQKCCTAKPWKYTALAVELLGMRDIWQNEAFMQYVDRWVRHGVWASPDSCAPYNGNPGDYGIGYGLTYGKCVAGGGRHVEKHGTNRDSGYYSNKFAEQMWDKFKK